MKNFCIIKKLFLSSVMLITLSLFCTGCDSKKPFAVFSSEPVTSASVSKFEKVFAVNTRIYYAVVVPKGFKDNVIRVQLIKKDEKTEFWGYKPVRSQDFQIQNAHYFLDYVVLSEKGYYFLRVFEKKNLDKPIIHTEFWVGEQ